METAIKSLFKRTAGIKLLFLALAISFTGEVFAQHGQSVKGTLIDANTNQPVPYASASLIKKTDQKLLTGTLSDLQGRFIIGNVPDGSYSLILNFLGYKPSVVSLDVLNKDIDAGVIYMQDTIMIIGEATVVGERVKAKSEGNKTTFFMTEKIKDAAGSGTDVLKFIPGVQVDLMQNISLEGSKNIMIYVDGKERDRNYIGQLSPDQIEKVEIVSVPTSKYDGNVTGAINIILKKDRDSGLSGKVFGELPLSGSLIYIFPTLSLNYNTEKLNLYASYKGDLTYLDLHEETRRSYWNGSDTTIYITNQYLRQKNWSHRFTYGLDYSFNTGDMIDFYAFCNPYSRELDGNTNLLVSGSNNDDWQARKEDKDANISTFYSLFYKHPFEKTGHEISVEINNYNLKAKNITEYIYDGTEYSGTSLINSTRPRQNAISFKIDYSLPIVNSLSLSTGIKGNFQIMRDDYSKDFRYNERIMASYGTISWKQAMFELTSGLRVERSLSEMADEAGDPVTSFLPNASFRYKISSHQNIQLSCNRTIRRPNLYQLNPVVSSSDPYTIAEGNPLLKQEISDNIDLEYSLQLKSNYLASRLFWSKTTNLIDNLTFINNSGLFETLTGNLGTISGYGIQFTGSFRIGNITLNPFLKLYDLKTASNTFAEQYKVYDRNNLVYETSLSAIMALKKGFTFSLVFQYNSPKNNIQDNSFCDPLYFLSIDKTIKQRIKVGIGSGLPFTRSFIYQGSDLISPDFSSYYKGSVRIPAVPVWFRLSYQFNTGKVRERSARTREEVNEIPKKGF